jgi:DNA integrity scanning protein DisA with diadenylate cyclase activity
MAYGIEASAKAIIDLTRDINNDIKKINTLGNELSSQLKTLGTTFQDEEYITIQGYITKTQQRVNDAVPDLKTVMGKLIEYAEFIKQSRTSV